MPFSDESISSLRTDKKAVRVFPLPVGEDIKTFSLLCIGITPNCCGTQKVLNLLLNHFLTRGFKILKISWSLWGFVINSAILPTELVCFFQFLHFSFNCKTN